MTFFDHAVSIARQTVPVTPLDRLAGDMLMRAHGLQARVRPVIDAARKEPREAAIQRLRVAARNLNDWVKAIDGAGADAASAMKRDGTNAAEIATVADDIAMCADAMERGR